MSKSFLEPPKPKPVKKGKEEPKQMRSVPEGEEVSSSGSNEVYADAAALEQQEKADCQRRTGPRAGAGRRQSQAVLLEALPSGSHSEALTGRRTRRLSAHFGLDAASGPGDVRITRRWRTTDCCYGQ